MNYILYPLFVIINLIGTALTFPLSFFIVLFKTEREGWLDNATSYGMGTRLVKWLNWFQTPDNSLDGDAGFQKRYPNKNWWAKVQWLWRNPFYGFAVKAFDGSTGMFYSGDLHCDPANPGYILVTGHGLFQWVYYKKLGSKCLYLNFGWNIKALVDEGFINDPNNKNFIANYQATFAFSPRIV